MAEPWQRAETPGPVKAILVNSHETAADLLGKFRHPVVAISSQILEPHVVEVVEQVEKVCRAVNACIASSSSSILERLRGEGLNVKPFALLELADRLRDPSWMGLDGEGQHDLAILLGFHYYYSWLILSGLKSFAHGHLKTFSLDPYYQPNASYSLQNFVVKERWVSFMKDVAKSLESKKKEHT